jgi:hypothetical protein
LVPIWRSVLAGEHFVQNRAEGKCSSRMTLFRVAHSVAYSLLNVREA